MAGPRKQRNETTPRDKTVPRRKPAVRGRTDRGAKRRLLEAAGRVFAEKGFDGATGREICERAEINAAAVNYYFGGFEGLYTAVLREIPARLLTVKALTTAVDGKVDAKEKLEAFLGMFVRVLTGPASASWVLRVLAREMAAPSPVLATIRNSEILPKGRILRSIVAELTGLTEDHPAVARGCVSVIAPCFMLLVFDRRTLKRMFPAFGLTPGDADAVTRHVTQFALAGLSAIAEDARLAE